MTPPRTHVDRAVAELRDLIFSGTLGSGSEHRETDLAERLGMSRTPVREAGLILESQGLVRLQPRRGLRVLPISPDDMREVYDVLTELESLAARRAAEAGFAAQDLETLSQATQDMDAALARGDRTAWAAADDRFHAELVRLGGNARLRGIVAMLSDQVRRARAVTLHLRPTPHGSNEDHRQVLQAIAAGEPERAATLHRTHRQEAGRLLVHILERMQLNQV